MKLTYSLAVLTAFFTYSSYGQNQSIGMDPKPGKDVSCKLTTPELQQRKATVIAELKALVQSRTEVESGFRYVFEGTDDILDKLNIFIKTERLCCDFFVFQLTIREDHAELLITGPEGASQFLKEEMDF